MFFCGLYSKCLFLQEDLIHKKHLAMKITPKSPGAKLFFWSLALGAEFQIGAPYMATVLASKTKKSNSL